MRNTDPKRYLIHIRLDDHTFSAQRAAEIGKTVKEMIAHISKDNHELAYITRDGSSFAFLVKTKLPAGAIMSILEGTQWEGDRTAILSKGDKVLILEIGEDFSGLGFSKAWTWLQHNQQSSTS